jgi:hypothetical protein
MSYNLRLCHWGCDRLIFQLAARPLFTRSERVAAAARKEKQARARPCTHTPGIYCLHSAHSLAWIYCVLDIWGGDRKTIQQRSQSPLWYHLCSAARIAKVCLNGQTLLVIKVMGWWDERERGKWLSEWATHLWIFYGAPGNEFKPRSHFRMGPFQKQGKTLSEGQRGNLRPRNIPTNLPFFTRDFILILFLIFCLFAWIIVCFAQLCWSTELCFDGTILFVLFLN